jgi:hypothetical protein
MAIDYGTDRIFIEVKNCPACGSFHGEMEFKRLAIPTEKGETHRARCPKSKSWAYIKQP